LATYLHEQPGWYRVQTDPSDVPYNFGDWFGVEQFHGAVPSVPEKMYRVSRADNATRLLGVGYYLARKAPREGLVDAYESSTGVKVFRDPKAVPPLWTVHDSSVPEAPADLGRCAPEDDVLTLESRTPRFVVMVATMKCRGMAVVADTNAPGWRA